MASGWILKLEPTDFANGFDVGCRRKRGVRGTSKNQPEQLKDAETRRRANLGRREAFGLTSRGAVGVCWLLLVFSMMWIQTL